MVLAIGIVVDDAIVVIENVERIMSEEHLGPKEATRKAMGQISGAIVAITVVLAAVFIPSALQPGATGIVYAQFALTIAVSMGFSALLAMSFTPALCAAILKPSHEKKKIFLSRWFNSGFEWLTGRYHGYIGSAVRSRLPLDGGLRVDRRGGRLFVYPVADQLRPRRGSGVLYWRSSACPKVPRSSAPVR